MRCRFLIAAILPLLLTVGCNEENLDLDSGVGATPPTEPSRSAAETANADPSAAAAADNAGEHRTETVSSAAVMKVEVVKLSSRAEPRSIRVDDNRPILIEATDGTRREVRVDLHEAMYVATLSLTTGAGSKQWRGTLFKYELRPTGLEVPYVWVVWSRSPLGRFRQVTDPAGPQYLAWVSFSDLLFADLSKPRESEEALQYIFPKQQAPDIVRVPVGSLVELKPPEGEKRGVMYRHMRAEAITADAEKGWTVVVSGANPGEVYTFISEDGKTWQRK